MDTEPRHDDVPLPDDIPDLRIAAIQRRPTVWPVFVMFIVMAAISTVGQVAVLIGWVIWQLDQGEELGRVLNGLKDSIATPAFLAFAAVVSEATICLCAFIGAWFLRERTRVSLGLGKPNVPGWSYPIIMIGALAPGAVGALLAVVVAKIIPPSDALDKACEELTWLSGPPFIVLLSIAPGFCEELFFRGYMQRRLLQAWSPWSAIFITSVLFGVLHFEPHAVVFAFVIGLSLGVVAWRTGSIWPGMLCHAFWNACSLSVSVILKNLGMEDDPPLIPTIVAGAVALICFVASVWILWRQPAPSTGGSLPVETPITVFPLEWAQASEAPETPADAAQ